MRITSQYAKLSNSSDDVRTIWPLKRKNFYSDPSSSSYKDFNTTNPPFTYHSEGGFEDNGGFI